MAASDLYEISTDPARLDLDVIHSFLSRDSYWAQGVPRALVERAFANSLCFGVYLTDGEDGPKVRRRATCRWALRGW